MDANKNKSDNRQPVYNFHRFLRSAMMRKEIGFSQLSQASGVNVKTLYSWANGTKPRDIIQVYSIAKVLGLTIEELMFGFPFVRQGPSYELVLYRISTDQLRERILTLPEP